MKILLVDDSQSARYALRLQLQGYGVEVATADSAEAALKELAGDLPDASLPDAILPDAILMDHLMPGLNGFEALERILADPRTKHVPVVICTASDTPELAARARAKGAAGILPKSAVKEQLPDLLAWLRECVARPGAERQVHWRPASEGPGEVSVGPGAGGLTEADLERYLDDWVARRLQPLVERLVDGRIEARLGGLLQPLFQDLKRDLADRLHEDLRDGIREDVWGLVGAQPGALGGGAGVAGAPAGLAPDAAGLGAAAPAGATPGRPTSRPGFLGTLLAGLSRREA